MKRRFFLFVIFLILLVRVFASIEKMQNYSKPVSTVFEYEREIIEEKSLHAEKNAAIRSIELDFIVPIIFIFIAYILSSFECEEFKIGTVEWKPKYRKQMPRGSLA